MLATLIVVAGRKVDSVAFDEDVRLPSLSQPVKPATSVITTNSLANRHECRTQSA